MTVACPPCLHGTSRRASISGLHNVDAPVDACENGTPVGYHKLEERGPLAVTRGPQLVTGFTGEL